MTRASITWSVGSRIINADGPVARLARNFRLFIHRQNRPKETQAFELPAVISLYTSLRLLTVFRRSTGGLCRLIERVQIWKAIVIVTARVLSPGLLQIYK